MGRNARFGATTNISRNASVAATGSTQADAARLKRGFQTVTAADGTKGVRLPPASRTIPGDIVVVKGLANAVLKVWPDVGGKINALSTDAAMSLPSGLIPATFIADTNLQWYTVPLLPS